MIDNDENQGNPNHEGSEQHRQEVDEGGQDRRDDAGHEAGGTQDGRDDERDHGNGQDGQLFDEGARVEDERQESHDVVRTSETEEIGSAEDVIEDETTDAPQASAPPEPHGLMERIADVRARAARNRSSIRGEETVKSGLVMPFIVALGYDVFDPAEVTPAFAPENGQRVDYAVRDGDDVRMLISVTSTPADTSSDRARRLAEAVTATGTRCAILTDGTMYRFHSDVDARGTMDAQPLFTLDLATEGAGYPAALAALCRETFDPVALIALGSEERRIAAVKHAIGDELADPSEAFVEIIRRHLSTAGITADGSLHAMINGVTLPLSRRMDETGTPQIGVQAAGSPAIGDDRVMTREETDGYNIVRALCSRYIDPDRVIARPAKSYCAILLDDNNRRSIARLHFNAQNIKHLGTFVGREETRNQIAAPSGIFELEGLLSERLRELDPPAFNG